MRIPVPLNALRAFEAAVRHRSIKEAAAELGVTPSAVSHQLRALEELLGVQLLKRIGARLEPTEAGRRLGPGLSQGFDHIAQAVAAVRSERREGPLRVDMLPSFATQWLSPRLARYPFERHGFSLQISTTQEGVDLAAGEADAGIWLGAGQWPGLVAERLFQASVDLYARPGHVGGTPRERLRALRASNLFVSRHCPGWRDWTDSLPAGRFEPACVTLVGSGGLTLQAAADGAGVAIAVAELADAGVRAGRLESVFGHRMPVGMGFHLVYPPALREDRRLGNLSRWLHAQAAAMRAEPSGEGETDDSLACAGR